MVPVTSCTQPTVRGDGGVVKGHKSSNVAENWFNFTALRRLFSKRRKGRVEVCCGGGDDAGGGGDARGGVRQWHASDDAVESNTKCTAAWLLAVHQQE